MHDVDAAGLEFLRAAAAAVHVEDLDFQALLAEETDLLRHPEGEHRVHGLGNTDLELGWFGSAGGIGQHRHHHECNDAKAELRPSMIALHLATCPSNTSASSGKRCGPGAVEATLRVRHRQHGCDWRWCALMLRRPPCFLSVHPG